MQTGAFHSPIPRLGVGGSELIREDLLEEADLIPDLRHENKE